MHYSNPLIYLTCNTHTNAKICYKLIVWPHKSEKIVNIMSTIFCSTLDCNIDDLTITALRSLRKGKGDEIVCVCLGKLFMWILNSYSGCMLSINWQLTKQTFASVNFATELMPPEIPALILESAKQCKRNAQVAERNGNVIQ